MSATVSLALKFQELCGVRASVSYLVRGAGGEGAGIAHIEVEVRRIEAAIFAGEVRRSERQENFRPNMAMQFQNAPRSQQNSAQFYCGGLKQRALAVSPWSVLPNRPSEHSAAESPHRACPGRMPPCTSISTRTASVTPRLETRCAHPPFTTCISPSSRCNWNALP